MTHALQPKPKYWVHWIDGEGNERSQSFDHYYGDTNYGIVGAWDLEHELLPKWMRREIKSYPAVTVQRIRPELGEGPAFDGPAARRQETAKQASFDRGEEFDYAAAGPER